MRIIADILTDHKWFGFVMEGEVDEEERIIEIDVQDDIINIFLKDRKNTIIAITEEDLNAIGYFKNDLNTA